jgi:hypothetical protein
MGIFKHAAKDSFVITTDKKKPSMETSGRMPPGHLRSKIWKYDFFQSFHLIELPTK